MSYTVPVKDMLFVMENLAELDKLAGLPGLSDSNSDTARAVLEEECQAFCTGRGPTESVRRPEPKRVGQRQGRGEPGLWRRLSPVRRRRVARYGASRRIRGPRARQIDFDAVHRNAQRCERRICAVPTVDRRRYRSAANGWFGRTQGALSAETH